MVAVGTCIDDKYKIAETIGVGGFGVVYAADQLLLNRRVAVKILNTTLLQDPDGLPRFEREAKAINALKHKNIVGFYGYGVWQQSPYMVMELAEGISLNKILAREGQLPAARALRLMREVFDALSCAHATGVVHRDLKPSNIIVATGANPGEETVKLIDFGLAKLMPGYGVVGQKLTETGYALGTCHYMPPEQALGQSIDQRADIYSAGCILYQMLTGKLPFEAEDSIAVMFQHINEMPEPLANYVKPPAPLEAITTFVNNCMAKDMNDRYTSAEQAIKDIDNILQGRLTSVIPLAVTAPVARRSERKPLNKKVLIALALFFLILLTSALVSMTHREQQLQALVAHQERMLRVEQNVSKFSSMFNYAEFEEAFADKQFLSQLRPSKQIELCQILLRPTSGGLVYDAAQMKKLKPVADYLDTLSWAATADWLKKFKWYYECSKYIDALNTLQSPDANKHLSEVERIRLIGMANEFYQGCYGGPTRQENRKLWFPYLKQLVQFHAKYPNDHTACKAIASYLGSFGTDSSIEPLQELELAHLPAGSTDWASLKWDMANRYMCGRNFSKAKAIIAELRQRGYVDGADELAVGVNFLQGDYAAAQKICDALIAAKKIDIARTWRVRIAIAQRDWKTAEALVRENLSEEDKRAMDAMAAGKRASAPSMRWQLFDAYIARHTGHADAAKLLVENLRPLQPLAEAGPGDAFDAKLLEELDRSIQLFWI